MVCRRALGSRILALRRLPGHQRRAPACPHPGPVRHAAQRRRDQPDHRVPRASGQHRGTRVTASDKPALTGKRLIEDAIPIDVVSRTSASEKVGGRIGHPASLHLWWARRPLAASRAAVYAALVPAEGQHRNPEELAEFFDSLCRWGGPESAIHKAREEVL